MLILLFFSYLCTMRKRNFLFSLLFFCMSSVLATEQQPMRLWFQNPAIFFEESLPIGNGRLGALIYGNPQDDVLQLNDITLWSGQPIDRNEDAGASKWIPEIRKALFAEDYRRADSLQLHVQGHNSSHYQPLATIHIVDHSAASFSDYRRELDIDSAIARTIYKKGNVSYQREYLASAPDQLIAVHLTASKPKAINVEVRLTSILNHKVKATGQQLTLTGHANGDPQESTHFCTIVRVVHRDGTVEATDSVLQLTDVSDATIYVVNETSFNGYDHHPVRDGAPYLERATDRAWHTANISYPDMRQRHIADYRQFYARLKLSLETASTTDIPAIPTDSLLRSYGKATNEQARYLETLYFQYGRYLLISCSRTPSVPANLQGLWNPHLYAPWRGNYTININLEENYWPAFVANLAEMAEPLDGFVTALAENGRFTARNYYGARRGWSAGHNTDIWAMANPVGEKREKPEWANWPMGGAWLVETLWERYCFTQDLNYLKQTAYPLMRGAAEFCLDWLVENPNNPQEIITAPSTSPENEYVTDKGYHGMTCYGGTADMAIIRELFINTIEAARLVGEESEFINDLAKALPRLHPYTIGQEGDLNEWYYDWRDYDPHHRHQSHLIGLYPGCHLTTDKYEALTTLSTLKEALEKTLIQKGDQTTGWSTGWRINLWARLHKGNEAFHIYQKLLTYVSPDNYRGPDRQRPGGGTYPNLFDAHPPFQIDGNFGGTAGVCEMLIQSTDEITLLPALPSAWPNGEVSGLCARGGFEVSMRWRNGKVEEAQISSKRGGIATVRYNGKMIKITLKPGKTKTIHG